MKRRQPGKRMPRATYVHGLYERVVVPADTLSRAKGLLPAGAQYDVVKYDHTSEALTFTDCRGWDEASEPVVGRQIRVAVDGIVRVTERLPDPWIYHHKWLFVADDYDGFDVEESRRWSAEWSSLPELRDPAFRARIGRRSFWETEVLPRVLARRAGGTATTSP